MTFVSRFFCRKQCYKPTIFLAQIDKHLLIYYNILKARLRIRPTKVSVLAPLVVLAQVRLFYCVIIAISPQDCNHIAITAAKTTFRRKIKKPGNKVSRRFFIGAGNRNRTHNLLITNQLLCQLSYASTKFFYYYKG